MELTHIRTENGTPELITTRAALDEINAGMMGDTKRNVRTMSASGSSATIEYRDGRKVDIRPATPEEIAELTAPAVDEKPAPEWRTLKGVQAPFDTHVWPHNGIATRTAGGPDGPKGDRITIVELNRGRSSAIGLTADGVRVNFGGFAGRHWIAAN